MEGLFFLIIVGGAILSILRKSKKAAQKRDAQPQPPKPAQRERIPFTREEWETYLREQGVAKKAVRPAQAAQKVEKPAPKPAAQSVQTPAHSAFSVVSTEGEAEAEHAEHVRRILADEAATRQQSASELELRRVNRARLRQAVVMREILDRPVALRDE